eukprot:CAMPEP_0179218876 /NCGR_PEP_ID=MMETSP0797-20121207/4712_1 /TAXON_ID=47934 /ORGANISM="Dinophysis acuminata, Strain DAEP01" /LENGTH=156 /DNA_ID=CAMNT_0020925263 /DNA_START=163 /DNA_END=633 /DNA_ORIENTATION=+
MRELDVRGGRLDVAEAPQVGEEVGCCRACCVRGNNCSATETAVDRETLWSPICRCTAGASSLARSRLQPVAAERAEKVLVLGLGAAVRAKARHGVRTCRWLRGRGRLGVRVAAVQGRLAAKAIGPEPAAPAAAEVVDAEVVQPHAAEGPDVVVAQD